MNSPHHFQIHPRWVTNLSPEKTWKKITGIKSFLGVSLTPSVWDKQNCSRQFCRWRIVKSCPTCREMLRLPALFMSFSWLPEAWIKSGRHRETATFTRFTPTFSNMILEKFFILCSWSFLNPTITGSMSLCRSFNNHAAGQCLDSEWVLRPSGKLGIEKMHLFKLLNYVNSISINFTKHILAYTGNNIENWKIHNLMGANCSNYIHHPFTTLARKPKRICLRRLPVRVSDVENPMPQTYQPTIWGWFMQSI